MEDQRQEADGCSIPPALDDLALIAAVDGEAQPEIIAHLRACQHCTERANEFAELQGLLRGQFYRMFCPSSDDLAAFQQGLLKGGPHSNLADHLATCPHCAGELQLLAQITSAPLVGRPPPFYWLKRVVAELLTPAAPLAGAYGALRGSAHAGQYAYRAENLQITIGVQRVANHPDRRVVLGALALEDDLLDTLGHTTASLLRNDTLISTAELDDLGNFVLDDLAPGIYSLSLRLPDREVVVESLTL
jgi:hypothetical protein